MAVDRSEIAVFIRPFIPDRHTMVLKILYIRISCNKPQQFIDDGLEMNFLGCQERKTFAQVITHLITEHTLGAGSGAVTFHSSVFTDMFQKFEILLHYLVPNA